MPDFPVEIEEKNSNHNSERHCCKNVDLIVLKTCLIDLLT